MSRFLETFLWPSDEGGAPTNIIFDLTEINVVAIEKVIPGVSRIMWRLPGDNQLKTFHLQEEFSELTNKIWGDEERDSQCGL